MKKINKYILLLFLLGSFFIVRDISFANICGLGNSCVVQTTSSGGSCVPAVYNYTTNLAGGGTQYCTQQKIKIISAEYITDAFGNDTQVSTSESCVLDPETVSCTPLGNPQCTTNADCPASDACNQYACVFISQTLIPVCIPGVGCGFNDIRNNTTCSRTSLCAPSLGEYCGDSVCNNGETNATCAQDCPLCVNPGWVSIERNSFTYQGGQGAPLVVGWYPNGQRVFGPQQSFECPAGNSCNGSTANPQNFSHAINDPGDFNYYYSHTIYPQTLGWQTLNYTATAQDSNLTCGNRSYSGSYQIYVYRGDPRNVTVDSNFICGANYISWTANNPDDRFDVVRAPVSNPASYTTIASNITNNYFTDNTATIGTKYLYYVRITNRLVGDPAATLIAANQNYGPTNGMAPVACPAVSLSANPTSVTSGSSSNLTWTVSGATSCTSVGPNAMPVGNWSTGGSSVNISTGSLTASRTYQLRCTGATGATINSQAVTVTVGSPPPGNPPTINVDTTSQTVSGVFNISGWAMDNTTVSETAISSIQVKLDGVVIGNANVGSINRAAVCAIWSGRPGCPNIGWDYNWDTRTTSNGSHTLTFTAFDSDSPQHSDFRTLVLTVNNPAPTITLTASPSSISSGSSSTLGWTITNANFCISIGATTMPAGSWSGNSGASSTGSVSTGSLSSSQTYRIRCTGPGGTTDSNSVTVTVNVVASCTGGGSIARQWWTGIAGNNITDLTSNVNYPNSPTGSNTLTSFETPSNWGDNHGQRVYGLLRPAITGNYTFYVASDDASELWLSTNGLPANKVRIAYLNGWASPQSWTVSGTQQSVPIALTAGQTYYIEAIHKEGAGGDNLAVGWILPGNSYPPSVIPGACLSTYTPPACPVGSVSLANPTRNTGQTTTASAPAGFSGGIFSSSNSGVASVSGSTITGVSAGSANISGSGWSYSNGATNCSLGSAGITIITPPVCPAGSVSLGSPSILTGQTTTASAPAGFSGGIFSSSNSGVASVSGSTVSGSTAGSANITGSGWSYSNGATNCSLSAAPITVSVPNVTATLGASSVSIPYNSSTVLNWAIANSTSAVITSSPTDSQFNNRASTNTGGASDNTSNLTANTTYTLTAQGNGGPVVRNVTVSVYNGPPGGGSNISVTANTCPTTGVTLTWTAGSGATSYRIYRAVHGSPAALLTTVGNVLTYSDSPTPTSAYDYWVESVGGNGQLVPATTNSGAGITPTSCGWGSGPVSVTLNNTVCEQMTVTWTAVAGASSYKIYRNTTGTAPSIGVTAASYTGVTSPYVNSPMVAGIYYYWVTAVVSGVETLPTAATSNGQAVSTCTANLSGSDKDIVSVTPAGGSTANYGSTNVACDGHNPVNRTYKVADKIRFRINLCNNGITSRNTASSIVVTDYLTNLTIPATGWDAKYYNGSSMVAITPTVSGTAPNQILTFALPISINQGQYRYLEFEAQTANVTGNNTSRFQNTFKVDYNNGVSATYTGNRSTPLYLYYQNSNAPGIIEIAP